MSNDDLFSDILSQQESSGKVDVLKKVLKIGTVKMTMPDLQQYPLKLYVISMN